MKNFGAKLRPNPLDLCIAGLLLLLILATYAPVRHYGFVDYDDTFYVSQNDHVRSGWNAAALRWSFTSTEFGNWFPLTWISLMTDRQWFAPPEETPSVEPSAGPYHWTNVWLHALAAVLLLFLLKRLTGATAPSALVAFLFALHPVHVESVAWVSERKDVLSAVFWMLALLSYSWYASQSATIPYLLTLFFYGLGFLAKPMVVTLPLVLLLLDVWPLRRSTSRTRLWEKLPFYILAAAMAVVTYLVQRQGGAVRTLTEVPLGARLQNSLASAVLYIFQFLWPARLAVLYPLRLHHPLWQTVAAVAVIATITFLVLRALPSHPYLAVGWFWYLLTLLPVIGIVQVGLQVRADRYLYLPSIGLSIILAWGAADLWRLPRARIPVAGVCAAACAACIVLTARQIPYWQDSLSLFQHAIAVTGPNPFAHGYLGQAWEKQLIYEEAIAEYRRGLEIAPHNVALLVNLGNALTRSGHAAGAVAPLTEAAARDPRDARIQEALGMALAVDGRAAEAQARFEEALRLQPAYADAHDSLGAIWERAGRIDDAIAQFSEAIRLDPANAAARRDLQRAQALKEQTRGR